MKVLIEAKMSDNSIRRFTRNINDIEQIYALEQNDTIIEGADMIGDSVEGLKVKKIESYGLMQPGIEKPTEVLMIKQAYRAINFSSDLKNQVTNNFVLAFPWYLQSKEKIRPEQAQLEEVIFDDYTYGTKSAVDEEYYTLIAYFTYNNVKMRGHFALFPERAELGNQIVGLRCEVLDV